MNDLTPYRFVEISRQEAAALVIQYHYLHRKCPMSWCWGIKHEGKTVGVLTVGKPASWTVCCSAVGESKAQLNHPESRSRHVYELNRLWIKDWLPKNLESRFIGWCLRQLKKQDPMIVLVSYADGAHGHVGYVYQACNWHYTGQSAAFTDTVVQAGETVKVRRTPKHRYVWFATASWKELMKWPILPYPKIVAAHRLVPTNAEQQQNDPIPPSGEIEATPRAVACISERLPQHSEHLHDAAALAKRPKHYVVLLDGKLTLHHCPVNDVFYSVER